MQKKKLMGVQVALGADFFPLDHECQDSTGLLAYIQKAG